MELKYKMSADVILYFCSFNRTFMELKLLSALHRDAPRAVLIVPLWN